MDKVKRFLPIAVIVVLLAVGGFIYYQYHRTQLQLQALQKSPGVLGAQASEVSALVAQVGKLIDLPSDETPTLATVTDISKLQGQDFFRNAKNGDKVLIYTNAKKAILYDPNANKIIDVAPVNIGSPSAAETQPVKVAILNGTTSTGLTNKVEASLKKSNPDLSVVSKENAQRHDYTKTLVIPVTDAGRALISNLTASLNASPSALPAVEKKPDADLLIIAGKDRI